VPTAGTAEQPVDPAEAGQARVNQAGGNPKGPATSSTVYVDPKMADSLDQWNKTNLPGKRIIIRNNKIQLAHTDPDTRGFKYQDFTDENGTPTVDTSVSTTPDE